GFANDPRAPRGIRTNRQQSVRWCSGSGAAGRAWIRARVSTLAPAATPGPLVTWSWRRPAAVAGQNLEPTSPIGTYPGLVWSRARKMRENESDSGDGWRGPYDDTSLWAPRDPGGTDQAPADGPDLPAESGRPDTIAFGRPTDDAGGPGQGSRAQRGYGDPWGG